MNKKIIIFVLMVFVLNSFAWATIVENDPDNIGYYSFDSDCIDNLAQAGIDGTNNGATSTAGGILNNYCQFTQSESDFVSITNLLSNGLNPNNAFGVCFWMNQDSSADDNWFFSMSQATSTTEYFGMFEANSASFYRVEMFDSGSNRVDTVAPDTGNWNFFCANVDASGGIINVFVNGTSYSNDTSSSLNPTLIDNVYIGALRYNGADVSFTDGGIDEVSVWNRTLDSSEILFLYNGGSPNSTQQYPFSGPVGVTESTEGIIVSRQTGSVSFAGGGFNTISDIDFNLTVNNTPYYFGHTLQVSSSANSVVNCEVLLNGTVVGSSNRTLSAGQSGNIYIQTDLLSNETGLYNEVLQCQRLSGGGLITVESAICAGHLLVDSSNEIINNNFSEVINVWSDSSSFRNFLTVPFTTSNATLDSDHTLDLIVDYSVIFNHDSEDLIIIRVNLSDGQACTDIRRDQNTAGVGVGGNVCLFKNITVSTDYNVSVWVSSTPVGNVTVLDNFKIFTKEFLQDDDERETVSLSTATINSTFEEITNFSVSNVDHASVDIFAFAGSSIVTAGSLGTVLQQINIINGNTQTGFIYENSIPASEARITSTQEILESASIDSYIIQLNSSCDATTCTLVGGDMTAYFANIVPVLLNSFTLTAYDTFDNSSIDNFSVVVEGGSTFETTSGTLEVFTDGLVNLTITSNFNGGYFNVTVTNHNSSNSLNQSMNQTLISWNCKEKVSGANLNCTSPTESTIFNYNVIGNPNSQTLQVTGYFNNIETFNVSALDNQTLNSSFASSNVTFIPTISLGSGNLSACTFNTTSLNHTFSESVSGTPNGTILLINGSYNVTADCPGFAITTVTFEVDSVAENVSINLATTESVNFIFKDADSFALLNNTNISVSFIGAENFNQSTSNGVMFVSLITPSTYTITASADGFRLTQYIITVSSRSTQNVTILLQNTSNSELVLISVKDKFSGAPITLAKVTVQKFVSNAWQTDQILETDFQGRTEGHFVLSTVFYNFLVEFNNQTFFGVLGECSLDASNISICNTDPEKKLIYAEDVTNGILVEIDTDPNEAINTYQEVYAVSTTLNYTNTTDLTGVFRYAFINNDGFDTEGNLLVYKDGSLVCNETVTSSSGTMFCNVNVVNGTTSIFTAGAFVNGEMVDLLQQRLDGEQKFINWGVFGWWIAIVIFLLSWFFLLKEPSIALPVSYGSLSALLFFEVILRGISLSFWIILLVMAFIIIRIPKKGVV